MKKILLTFAIALVVLGFAKTSKAITWVQETGGGGWGNAELEYYQAANSVLTSNSVVITAKNQSGISGQNPLPAG